MLLQSGKCIGSESSYEQDRKGKNGASEMATLGNLSQLPQDCLNVVISLTTPRDACVSSAVSSTFRSVADSDAIWQKFLPSDYASFLSHAVDPVEFTSMKELYFQLCEHPVPIYGGEMLFGLDKSSGAKCFTIIVRAMNIPHINDKQYWLPVSICDPMFPEAALFVGNSGLSAGLRFSGRIASAMLSSGTTYAAYLIYDMLAVSIWTVNIALLQSTVVIDKVKSPSTTVAVHHTPCLPSSMQTLQLSRQDVEWSKSRSDGLMEVKIGEFYVKSGEDRKVKVKLQNPYRHIPRITIFGMDIRPKES